MTRNVNEIQIMEKQKQKELEKMEKQAQNEARLKDVINNKILQIFFFSSIKISKNVYNSLIF